MDCDLFFFQGEGTSSPVNRKEESVMKIDEGCEEEESKQKDDQRFIMAFIVLYKMCCARVAAVTRFGDIATKQYLSSIIQHTRNHYICAEHSEFIGM